MLSLQEYDGDIWWGSSPYEFQRRDNDKLGWGGGEFVRV